MVVGVAKYLRHRCGEGVRPGVDVVALTEELEHGGRRSGVVVDRGGVARRRFFGEVLSTGVLQELVDRLCEVLVRTLEEDELLALLVVRVLLSDLVDAAFGCGQVLVGIRCPYVEKSDVYTFDAIYRYFDHAVSISTPKSSLNLPRTRSDLSFICRGPSVSIGGNERLFLR